MELFFEICQDLIPTLTEEQRTHVLNSYQQLLYSDEPTERITRCGCSIVEITDRDFVTSWLVLYPNEVLPVGEAREAVRFEVMAKIRVELNNINPHVMALKLAESAGQRIQINRGPKGPDGELLSDDWQTLTEKSQWICKAHQYRVHPDDLVVEKEASDTAVV
jgi:hypothetical protein